MEVQICLSQHLGGKMTYISYEIHSSDLVVKHGSVILNSIEHVSILQEIYNFVNTSPKRHLLLCENLSKIEFGNLLPPPIIY